MKNLNLIFNFLLFPFLFLGRVTDRAYAFPSGAMGTRKKNYSISSLFFTIIITSLLFFPNTIKASGDESGKNCNNAELVTIPYDVDSQEFERVSYNNDPTKDRTTFVSWFEFTPIADGTMHMYSENASVDIVGVLRDNDCSTNDNLLKDNTTGTNDIDMAYDVVSGTTYKLRLTHTISGDHTADTPPTFDLAIEMLPPPNICTGTNGLLGDYYNNMTFTSPIALQRVDPTIDFDWGTGSPGTGVNSDQFSTRWTGTIYIPEDANYIFSVQHDDHIMIDINNTIIYDKNYINKNIVYPIPSKYYAAGTYPITIELIENGGNAIARLFWQNDLTIVSPITVPNINFCTTTTPPVTVLTAVDDTFSTPANTALVGNVFTNDIGNPGYTISAADVTGLRGVLTDYNLNTGAFTFVPETDFSGLTSFTYTIDDGTNTSTATVQISVAAIGIEAVDDSFDTYPDVTLRANILQNDLGLDITYTSMITDPTHGSVTVQPNGDFIYIPSGGYRGDDTFTYQITDANLNTDTAIVTITIATAFTSGNTTPFEIVNPDFSRNVIGDYKIAGNTVLCLIDETNGYGDDNDICHGDTDFQFQTSNNRVSKYLDIDGDNGTWNSTSSYIDLNGTPYDPTRGVIWAGLFWEGRVSSADTYNIRYYTENYPSAPTAVEVGSGGGVGNIDVSTIGTQNIKLKIDNGSYNDVISSTFHTAGQTYSAYADVSAVLQSASLTKDKHVFTVANLTTMEGREGSPGAFGGWALVVVYAETHEFGKPRNISIYNGFIDIAEDDDPITISGFKLPTTGDVLAQLSVFSGEGEHLYGYRAGEHDNHDWLKISNDDSSYSYMDGLTLGDHVGNRDNSFNAQLDNILRDSIPGEYNDLEINNVGVDIDNYDVSDLMTSYRDLDQNISEIQIKTSSDWDYITMSMIAFSAELYVPDLCYDYTLDIDGYVLDSVNNEIKTPFGDFGKPLTTVLYLKSLEGDIILSNVDVNYTIIDTNQVAYLYPGIDCTTEISEVGVFSYSDACIYTTPSTLVGPGSNLYEGFSMHIGTGKTPYQGGTISAFEDRYIRFDSILKQSVVSTVFDFSVSFSVDYGSGAVPVYKIFTPEDICEPTTSGFLPELGAFNITDRANSWDQWNLYTQVSRRAFDLRLWAYALDAGDYTGLIASDLNMSLEVEAIRADNFSSDANTACNDEHSILPDVDGKFLHFNVGKYIDFGYEEDQLDFSYRSVGLRIWYLGDVDGTGTITDDHNCTRVNQSLCVDLYTDRYASKTACQYECRDVGSTGNCYDCLRSNYGQRVCSRDNFAIRPESFITELLDSNESNNIDDPSIHIANSVSDADPFSVVAGYKYRFDINATNHVNDEASPRYIQHFDPGDATHWVRMTWDPDGHIVSGCNDVEDQNISINLFNGSDVNYYARTSYTDKVTQIGKYRFEIFDSNWTSADWSPDEMPHHFGSYSQYYDSATDCASDTSDVLPTSATVGKNGCEISSVHTNPDRTGHSYNALLAQYYPSQFLVNDLIFTAGPVVGSNFVYINTLDDTIAYPDGYPNGIDENMSYNVQGTFKAAGFDDGEVSNFVDNCYAEDVNMSLYQSFQHTVPGTTPNLSYDLMDYNISDRSDVIRPREQGAFTFANDTSTALPLPASVIGQGKEYFRKDMGGAISMDLGYNFNRRFDTALNPRLILMNDFNITYTVSPADVHFAMQTDHKIYGNRVLDQNISFIYGRAKPGKSFYEDVTMTSIDTPVSVLTYCDLGFTICQDRIRILLNDAGTNEGNWWLSLDHRTLDAHGDIVLQIGATDEGPGNPTVTPDSPNALSIIADATDNAVSVSSGVGSTLPLTVEIDLQTNTASPVTDRWLIYNEYDNTVPSPFYKVRFIGDSNWTGIGDEGMVVGTDASKRNTKRLDW